MCMKLPRSKAEMLNVSGVGAAKFEKYGQRILDEISGYQAEHPDVVISIQEGAGEVYESSKAKKNGYKIKVQMKKGTELQKFNMV